MLPGTLRQVSNPYFPISNPNTTIVLYYYYRREKTRQCQDSGMKGGFATMWGANYRQGKGHQGG